MWDLNMFFYEIRLTFSIFLFLLLLYAMRAVDIYLLGMMQRVGGKILKVPVLIEEVLFTFPSKVVIKGVHVQPPPQEVDNRWEWEDIITVDEVHVHFQFHIALWFFVLSFGELGVVQRVEVVGLRFFVEGHRPSPHQDTVYNVSLLGGGKRSKPQHGVSSGSGDEGRALLYGKMEAVDNYFVPPGDDHSKDDGNDGSKEPHCSGESSIVAPAPTPARSSGSGNHSGLWKHWRATTSQAVSHFGQRLHREASQFHQSVQQEGFYQATKKKISNIYQHTKQSIELSVKEHIKAIHCKLCGQEPTTCLAGEPRLICEKMVFDVIEVHMLRALPVQIRHLEDKPLTVRQIEFDHLGYEGLTVHPLLAVVTSSSLSPSSLHRDDANHNDYEKHVSAPVQVSFGDITEGQIIAKVSSPHPHKVDKRHSFTSTIAASSLSSSSSSSSTSLSPSSTPLAAAAVAAAVACTSSHSYASADDEEVTAQHSLSDSRLSVQTDLCSISYGQRVSSSDEVLTLKEVLEQDNNNNSIKSIKGEGSGRMSLHNPRGAKERLILDYSSVDFYSSGLHVMLLKYRFEQQLLLALYQGNAGRVIMDILNITHWNISASFGSSRKHDHHQDAHDASAHGSHGHSHPSSSDLHPARHSPFVKAKDGEESQSFREGKSRREGGPVTVATAIAHHREDVFTYSNPLFLD